MHKLRLLFFEDWKSYRVEGNSIDDEKLGLLWLLMTEIPIYDPSWLIDQLKEQSIGGMNIVEFDYENQNIIISDQFNSYDEKGPYISIEESKLFELIKKFAQLSRERVSKIILTRSGENYEIREE